MTETTKFDSEPNKQTEFDRFMDKHNLFMQEKSRDFAKRTARILGLAFQTFGIIMFATAVANLIDTSLIPHALSQISLDSLQPLATSVGRHLADLSPAVMGGGAAGSLSTGGLIVDSLHMRGLNDK